MRGIFAAALLAGIEKDLGHPLLDHFDLVVGTSTGGIIALGLGAGLSPRQILDFYVAEKNKIFPNPFGWRSLRYPFVAKYRSEPLSRALQDVFGERLLGDSQVPLVVPSYDLGENCVHLFKTPHHERLARDYEIPMWEVGMATSAAPTFFPVWRLREDRSRLIDGGVWANNPATVGVTEAVSMFGRQLSDLRLLSVGTTSQRDTKASKLDNAGLLRWARKPHIVEVLMRGQSRGAYTQAAHLIGQGHAWRLDPLGPDDAELDRCDADELIGKASHHSRDFSPHFQQHFSSHLSGPYTPLRP